MGMNETTISASRGLVLSVEEIRSENQGVIIWEDKGEFN
jgi:hypothetical protein